MQRFGNMLECRSAATTLRHGEEIMLGCNSSALPSYPFEIGPYGTSTLTFDTFRLSTPVCRVMLPSGLEAWLVTRYADICTILRDPTFSREEAIRVGAALVKAPSIEVKSGVLQNTDGQHHSRLRSVFATHYSQSHASRWIDVIQTIAHETIDSLLVDRAFDLRAQFFEPVARRSAEKIFGFPLGRGSGTLELFFDEQKTIIFQERLVAMLREQDPPAGSFLDALKSASRNGLISEPDLVVNLIVLMTVTFQAVGGPFLGGIFALLRDRNQWETCRLERSRLPNAVDEMLRCYPNGDGQFLRVALDNVVLSGVDIRRGEAVLAPAAAANVDPAVFPDPRRFDVLRPNSNRHIAFGLGSHRCLGSTLVEVWMLTALAALLERLPSLRLAVEPKSITFRPISLINIMDRLPVTY